MGKLAKFNKRVRNILVGAVLLSSQMAPMVAFIPRAAADGDDSPDACLDTTVNVDGSIEDTGDFVSHNVGTGYVVDGVCIKSGEAAFDGKKHTDVLSSDGLYGNGCYTVSGIGTQEVSVTRTDSSDCKDISHIDVVKEQVEVPDTTVQVKKVVSPSGDPGKFDLYIDGKKVITDAVNGSISEKVVVDEDESVEVKETPGTGLTNFDDYTTSIVCTNQLQQEVASSNPTGSSSRSKTINKNNIDTGDSILCIFTNTKLEVPEVDFCDPSDRPAGMSIAEWFEENDFDGSNCFELEPVQVCGSFDITFNDLTGLGFEVRYVKDDETPDVADWEGDGVLPANFPEDYNGGSVEITYYIVGPEKDYVKGTSLPNIWDSNGVTVVVNTDCEANTGGVIVTKFNDENKNGVWDEGENALPNWNIQLNGKKLCEDYEYEASAYSLASLVAEMPELCDDAKNVHEKTTNEDGQATFNVNYGMYEITETLKSGWEQTGIYCDPLERIEINRTQENGVLYEMPSNHVMVYVGQTRYCYVGNYQQPDEPDTPGQVLGDTTTTTTYTPQVLSSTGSNVLANIFVSLMLIGTVAGLHRFYGYQK